MHTKSLPNLRKKVGKLLFGRSHPFKATQFLKGLGVQQLPSQLARDTQCSLTARWSSFCMLPLKNGHIHRRHSVQLKHHLRRHRRHSVQLKHHLLLKIVQPLLRLGKVLWSFVNAVELRLECPPRNGGVLRLCQWWGPTQALPQHLQTSHVQRKTKDGVWFLAELNPSYQIKDIQI